MQRKTMLYNGASVIPVAIGAGIAKVREENDRWNQFTTEQRAAMQSSIDFERQYQTEFHNAS